MRTFYALTFEQETKEALVNYRDLIGNRSLKGRFTRMENFHLTLEFMGETGGHRLQELLDILEALNPAPMTLTASYIGSFKKREREIVWMGIEKNMELLRLHRELTDHLKASQIPIELRKYKPHITLGRQVLMTENLENMIVEPLIIPVKSVALMESRREGEVLVYEALEEILLT